MNFHHSFIWKKKNFLYLPVCVCPPGGEAQADRAHSKREEDSSGCHLSFPCAVRVFLQGTDNFSCCNGCVLIRVTSLSFCFSPQPSCHLLKANSFCICLPTWPVWCRCYYQFSLLTIHTFGCTTPDKAEQDRCATLFCNCRLIKPPAWKTLI